MERLHHLPPLGDHQYSILLVVILALRPKGQNTHVAWLKYLPYSQMIHQEMVAIVKLAKIVDIIHTSTSSFQPPCSPVLHPKEEFIKVVLVRAVKENRMT